MYAYDFGGKRVVTPLHHTQSHIQKYITSRSIDFLSKFRNSIFILWEDKLITWDALPLLHEKKYFTWTLKIAITLQIHLRNIDEKITNIIRMESKKVTIWKKE